MYRFQHGLLLGLLILGSCGKQAEHSRLVAVKMMVGRSPCFLPVLLAQQLGLYRKQGLAVTIDDASSTTKTTQALLGGSVDVAGGMYEQALTTAAQGQSVTSFVTLMSSDFRALVVSPAKTDKIRRVEDLRGAVIGVSTMGSPNQFFATSVVRRHGLSEKNVSIIAVGIFTSAVAALERNRVDAAVLAGSGINLFVKRNPKARILVDVRTSEGVEDAFGVQRFLTSVLYSTPKWLAANGDTAKRLARATCDGLRWIQDHSPGEIAQEMPQTLRTDFDVDRDAITALKANFSQDGLMSLESASAVEQALTALPENSKVQNVDLSKTFTNEFVQVR